MTKKYASKSLKFEVIYRNTMNLLDNIQVRAERSLKALEPYTKTDMVYLARGGFWLGIGQFFSSLSALLTSIAFANLLSPDAYGIYRYIISINALLLITTLSGMDSAVTQSVSRGYEGTLDIGVKTKIKWGVIGAIASFFIALYYFFQGNMMLAMGFSITAVFVPFVESFDMYNSMLWGKKLFDVQTKYNIIKKIIGLVSIVVAIILTKNIYIILGTYFISLTLPNIFFFFRTEKKHKKNNDIDSEAIKYGKNLSLINLLGLIVAEIDKVLVFQYVGASDLAKYTLAVAPTDQIKGLMKNINALAMPKFSQKSFSEIKSNIWKKILILGITTTSIVLIYIIVAPLFFNLFFPKYLTSVPYSQILSLSLIPVVIAGFLHTILESQKANKELYKYNIYSNLISIITLWPLVYVFGLWGAIISRVISRIFSVIYSIIILKRI